MSAYDRSAGVGKFEGANVRRHSDAESGAESKRKELTEVEREVLGFELVGVAVLG